MTYFDVHYLQESAINIVQAFLGGDNTLDQLIANKAEADELNAEQIKRLVEAVNTIAFLKKLQIEKDRTAEFSVASFDGVMAALVPTTTPKSAGVVKEAALSPQELIKYKTLAKRKKEQRLNQEHEAMLKKAFWQTACELENSFPDYVGNIEKALWLRKQAQDDPRLVASVTALKPNQVYLDFIGVSAREEDKTSLLKTAEMNQAREFLKEVEAVTEMHNAYQEKAAFLSECLEKQAGLFGMLGEGVGNLIKKPIIAGSKALGKGIANSARDAGGASKNILAAQTFARNKGMEFDAAVKHLSDSGNARIAHEAGFNPAGYQTEMNNLKRTGKNINRAFMGATAIGAAGDMHHNANNDINQI